MRLFITDNPIMDAQFDVVQMTAVEFNSIANHPYIATAGFDAIILNTESNVNIEYLKVVMKYNLIIPLVPDEITAKTVSILSTLYTDKAAVLNYTYMTNADGLKDYINSLREEYQWDKFY